jgi:hypothetical protein
LALLVLVFFFSTGLFIPDGKDVFFQYAKNPQEAWIDSAFRQGSYISVTVGYLLKSYGYDYFHAIGFWIVSLVCALWLCTYAYIYYIEYPSELIPLATLFIGLHTIWSPLVGSLSFYLGYATSLLACSLILFYAKAFENTAPLKTIFVIALGIWVICGAYPPMAFIPFFGPLFLLTRDLLLLESQVKIKKHLKIGLRFICGLMGGILLSLFSWSLLDLHQWGDRSLETDASLLFHKITFLFDAPIGGIFLYLGLLILLTRFLKLIFGRISFSLPSSFLSFGILTLATYIFCGIQLSLIMQRWWHYEQDYAKSVEIISSLRDSKRLSQENVISILHAPAVAITPLSSQVSTSPFISIFEHDPAHIAAWLTRISGLQFTAKDPNHRDQQAYAELCQEAETSWWALRFDKEDVVLCLSALRIHP